MCRNVVISPVISGPIILAIITGNPKSQIPDPKSQAKLGVSRRIGIWNVGFGIWDVLTMGGNARWGPIPVGGAVPADDAHREARGHCRAGNDARALPPLHAYPDLRGERLARSAGLHARARHPAHGRCHRASAAQLSSRRSVA